jgi:hypothetical protein
MLGGLLGYAFRQIARPLFRCKTTEVTGEYVSELFHLYKPLLVGDFRRLGQSSDYLSRILRHGYVRLAKHSSSIDHRWNVEGLTPALWQNPM